jgi:D-alanyl-D-alanine carboxypeptidase
MPDCLVAVVEEDGTLLDSFSDAPVAWWSFTKTLLAAAVLLLAERRRLALDAPLRHFPFTPRQLLQHRAGLPDYGGLPAYHEAVAAELEPWTDDEMLRRVPPERLLFQPGHGWSYSNVGYLLLRREVERALDVPFSCALAGLVLEPLGLHHSKVAVSTHEMAQLTFAPGHAYHPAWVAHGCVVGPVSEAALALHRLMTAGLLSPTARDAMLTTHPVGGRIEGRPWLTTGYGLGLMVGKMAQTDAEMPIAVAGHSAGGPGSVGAVYQRRCTGNRRTVAAFARGSDAGIAEGAALAALRGRPATMDG